MKTNKNEVFLGEIAEIIDCEHKTAPYIKDSEYKVVRTNNVRNGLLIEKNLKSTTYDGFKEWTKRGIPQYGDVFFTREAPAGETCMVPYGKKHCMGQRMVLLKPDNQKLYPPYIAKYLISERCKFIIYRYSIGSTVSRINICDIYKIPILLPPLPEQKAIADLLSTWDEAIEKSERLIVEKEKRFKWLLQNLINENNSLIKVKLGEVGEIKKGRGIAKADIISVGVPCIRYAEIYTKYNFNTKKLISHISKDSSSKTLELKAGDILFAASGETKEDIGKCVAYLSTRVAYIGGDTLILRPNLKLCNSMYLGFILNTSDANKQKSAYCHGNSVVHLYGKDLINIKIPLPPLPEQKQIAETLNVAQEEIKLLKQLAEKYKEQKRGLIQKLLTGEWRVKVD